MRIVFIGAVAFSARMLRTVLEGTDAEVVGVVSKDASPFNADFEPLGPIAEEAGIDRFLFERGREAEMAAWIRDRSPDVVYCLGWSHLLGPDVLGAAPKGVVGYHPAELPRNRGRHPIIWALALGLERTGSTFFAMDEGADSGDILSQETVPIEPDDDAGTLYGKLADIAARQLMDLTAGLAAGTVEPRPQDHSAANYWRKRGKADGRIDWRMAATTIDDLVRALTRPYPGAHFDHESGEVRVWRTRVVGADDPIEVPDNAEPGKVLAVGPDGPVVKCGTGAMVLLEHELGVLPAEGDYL